MRLVSYNLLYGGEGRADPLAEVIEAQHADVVALVEATDLQVIERIAGRLGFDFVQGPGKTMACALLTRWTIRESINHALLRSELTKSLLETTIVEPTGRDWNIGVLHLHAHAREQDEVIRENELSAVLDIFTPQRSTGRPHLLCGDFNANSPTQRIDPGRCTPYTRENWAENGGHLPRRVVQSMLDAGYADSLRTFRGEDADSIGTFKTQDPGQRLDYIFTHGIEPGRIKSAWVEQDRLAKYASDHFPVGIEID